MTGEKRYCIIFQDGVQQSVILGEDSRYSLMEALEEVERYVIMNGDQDRILIVSGRIVRESEVRSL